MLVDNTKPFSYSPFTQFEANKYGLCYLFNALIKVEGINTEKNEVLLSDIRRNIEEAIEVKENLDREKKLTNKLLGIIKDQL